MPQPGWGCPRAHRAVCESPAGGAVGQKHRRTLREGCWRKGGQPGAVRALSPVLPPPARAAAWIP